MMSQLKAPGQAFSFQTPQNQASTTPSYALAASKHAPANTTSRKTTTFRPVFAEPPPPPTRGQNAVTLAQDTKGGSALASYDLTTIIISLNNILTTAKIRESPTDTKPIHVRSAHLHRSNDIVVYTTTANQADRLRDQSEAWLPSFSPDLESKRPVYPMVVHGIPTTFNPTSPDHLRMLEAMNPDTFKTPPLFVKWISQQAVQRGESH